MAAKKEQGKGVKRRELSRTLSWHLLCADLLYTFKAARRAARAANSARTPLLSLALPQRRRLTPVGWRERRSTDAGRGLTPGVQGHGGFDKGTLAAAHIGLMRAGQKPARSPSQRKGYRPFVKSVKPWRM